MKKLFESRHFLQFVRKFFTMGKCSGQSALCFPFFLIKKNHFKVVITDLVFIYVTEHNAASKHG